MEKVIIVRYAEIHLKGKNRGYFEHIFCVNLEKALKGIRHELRRTSGRYLVAAFDEADAEEICTRISRVFGVHSYSKGYRVPNDLDGILEAALRICPASGTFKVDTHRADKRYPMTSPQLNAEIGARLLDAHPSLRVDVHTPEHVVYLDIREDGTALVFGSFEEGVGGMPVGTSSKGVLLISGGIDSPVAGYMMAKRGMEVEYLHFHSYPYTNEQARDKVIELARILSRYTGGEFVSTVKVTHIQEEIHKKCAAELNVTLLRRFMFRIAECVARKKGAKCLITGESLGQVASQTIEGITSSRDQAQALLHRRGGGKARCRCARAGSARLFGALSASLNPPIVRECFLVGYRDGGERDGSPDVSFIGRDDGIDICLAGANRIVTDRIPIFPLINRGFFTTIFSYYLVIIVFCLT